MFGIQDALMNVLLAGPAHASRRRPRTKGLVDEVVATQDELLAAAKAWIEANAGDEDAATQPWDRKGYRCPAARRRRPKLAAILPAFPANLRKQVKGADYKAPARRS